MPQLDFGLLLQGQYLDWLLSGFVFSMQLTGLSLLGALPLATTVALLRLSPSRVLRGLGFAFVESIRNVPLLVQMLFWYFAAPDALPEGIKGWLYAGNIEASAAVMALTLYTAAYMAEDIRSGVRAVPRHQHDAARALGLGYLACMQWVILPQAWRITVPPLISQTLNLWKNTSLATVIGVAELMYQAQRVESESFRGFETFAVATAGYLGLSLLITALAAAFARRYPVRPAR